MGGQESADGAEWEFAARGGLEGAEYAWGDELTPGGQILANSWFGLFPFSNQSPHGWEQTSPVRSFPPNALLSDNGAAADAGPQGEFDGLYRPNTLTIGEERARLAELGTGKTQAGYPRPWVMAGNTPLRFYKTWPHPVESGRHSSGMALSRRRRRLAPDPAGYSQALSQDNTGCRAPVDSAHHIPCCANAWGATEGKSYCAPALRTASISAPQGSFRATASASRVNSMMRSPARS